MAHLVKFQSVWAWVIIVLHLSQTTYCVATSSDPSHLQLLEANPDSIELNYCCLDDDLNPLADCTNNKIPVKWNDSKLYRNVTTNILEAKAVDTTGTKLACKEGILLTVEKVENSTNSSIRTKAAFNPDGHLQYEMFIFSSDDYCIQGLTSMKITVLACNYSSHCATATDKQKSSRQTSCLTRCCNYGEAWDISAPKLRCANSGRYKWEPELYSDVNSNSALSSVNTDGVPLKLHTHPRDLVRTTCWGSNYTFISPHSQIQEHSTLKTKYGNRPFKILQDGTVWIKLRKRKWAQLLPGEYCIDGFQFGEGNFSGDSANSLLFECKAYQTTEDAVAKQLQRKYSLGFGILLSFCLIFLLVTAIVYVLLWSKHNIHGWTVFCYILALLVTYLLLGTSHFAGFSSVREGQRHGSVGIDTFCGIIGILCHFSFLSTFSWSTVLNFDLWCTFRHLRPASGKSTGRKKFFFYCLFAMAVPTLIVAVGIVLDLQHRDDVYSDTITPEYGKAVCYVDPRDARVYYIILPIAVLLGINLTLFCNTACSLYRVKKSTEFASSSSTKGDAGNQTFRLILKLLLVNGTIWIAEIISWYLQTDYEEVGIASFILDIVNVLQAVAIFFLFVFKTDILEALKRSYPCLEGIVDASLRCKGFSNSQNTRESITASTNTSLNRVKVNGDNLAVTNL